MPNPQRPPLRERVAARLAALRKRAMAAHQGISTTMEVGGCTAVTVGVSLVYAPAGWIAGGLLAVGLGYLVGRPQ